MENKSFSGELTNHKSVIKVNLPVISFQEDDVFFVYCPALDITGYGYTEQEASESFTQVLKMHINYTMNKGTFFDDLKEHGWEVKNKKSVLPPSLNKLMADNEDFREIVENRDFKKYSISDTC